MGEDGKQTVAGIRSTVGLFLVGGKSVKNKEKGNRAGQGKPLDGDSDLTP